MIFFFFFLKGRRKKENSVAVDLNRTYLTKTTKKKQFWERCNKGKTLEKRRMRVGIERRGGRHKTCGYAGLCKTKGEK